MTNTTTDIQNISDCITYCKYQYNKVIKLSSVQTFFIESSNAENTWSKGKSFLFVKLTTNDGIDGWGEAFTEEGKEMNIINYIHNFAEMIPNINSVTPWNFLNLISKDKKNTINTCHASARSAFEMALWDIYAKKANKSLSQLIGVKRKSSVSVYANIWSNKHYSDNDIVKKAKNVIKLGYRAIKIYPLQNRSISQAASLMKLLRSKLGKEIHILLDLECPSSVNVAINLEPLISPYNPYWYEEPFDGLNIKKLASITNQSSFDIVTGERQCGIDHFVNVINSQAAQILNPDISMAGGILDILVIAKLAHENNIRISPHCWNSMTISVATMLQICSVLPNAEMAELFPDFMAHSNQFMSSRYKITKGKIEVPDNLGLGIDMNEDIIIEKSSNTRLSSM